MARIYLDNNATTRTDPRVVEAMLPYFTERYGNAASLTHGFGQEADEAVEQARQQVADLIGAHPREIVFTSGATESNNLALKGVAALYRPHGDHFITAATEHKAVLDPLQPARPRGISAHDPAGGRLRPRNGRAGCASPDAADHPGQRHGRQ